MTIAGTTDTPTDVTHHPIPSEEDINFILNEVRNYLSCDVEGNMHSFKFTLPLLSPKPSQLSLGNCHAPPLTASQLAGSDSGADHFF